MSFPRLRQAPYPVCTMEGNLVINQVAPLRTVGTYMYHLVIFLFTTVIYTHIHTHELLSTTFKKPSNSSSSITQKHNKSLPIFQSETSFGLPLTRAFFSYKPFHDPLQFFERVFRNYSTSRLVLYVFLLSIICITDPIILRISRGTTYVNFIEI